MCSVLPDPMFSSRSLPTLLWSPAAWHPLRSPSPSLTPKGGISKMQIWASQSSQYLSAEGQILTRAETKHPPSFHHCLVVSLKSRHESHLLFQEPTRCFLAPLSFRVHGSPRPHCPGCLAKSSFRTDFLPLRTSSDFLQLSRWSYAILSVPSFVNITLLKTVYNYLFTHLSPISLWEPSDQRSLLIQHLYIWIPSFILLRLKRVLQ